MRRLIKEIRIELKKLRATIGREEEVKVRLNTEASFEIIFFNLDELEEFAHKEIEV